MGSSKYRERSSVHIVTDPVRTVKPINMNVTGVEGKVSLFSGIRFFLVWSQTSKWREYLPFVSLTSLLDHASDASSGLANVSLTIRCTQCNGQGVRITRLCGTCNGNKVVQIQHTLAVHIPAGAPENFEEVFSGEADESMDWEAGDVVVRVRSRRNEGNGGWGRKDGGLIGRVTLSVAEVSRPFC